MTGNILKRDEGISFDVYDSLETISLKVEENDKVKLLRDNSSISILYGNHKYPGTIIRSRGHEMYDVRYNIDMKAEAAVPLSRIAPSNVAFRMKTFGPVELPVICVPLRHRSKAVGVLCVDTMAR